MTIVTDIRSQTRFPVVWCNKHRVKDSPIPKLPVIVIKTRHKNIRRVQKKGDDE